MSEVCLIGVTYQNKEDQWADDAALLDASYHWTRGWENVIDNDGLGPLRLDKNSLIQASRLSMMAK